MKMIRMFMIYLIHLLALSNLAMASEDLAEDISQQENKQLRRSITYLGMLGSPKPKIEAHQIKKLRILSGRVSNGAGSDSTALMPAPSALSMTSFWRCAIR